MDTTANKVRPPYVVFELRPVEDREESIKQGCYVAKDVAFALITPAGSKDRIDRVAEEWLKHIAEEAHNGRFEMSWVRDYKAMFAEWKAGNEVPLIGTSVKMWSVASPAQVQMLLSLNLRTVEDLAQANEEALQRLGMGGRALKDKAIAWLQSAKGEGVTAEKISSLEAENRSLKEANETMRTQLVDLAKQVEALRPATGGAGAETKRL